MTILLALLVGALGVQTNTAGLKIVVIAGEDAVNVIQQKTAVAPIIEVRDRNDQPVAGATVLFALGRGNPAAFAGGARALSVTTDASGRAVATGLTATGKGTVRVTVTVKSADLTATTLITQANVETAAQAAAIAGAAGAAGGAVAAGAAAGGAVGGAASGGMSAGLIAGIAGAVGGGALVATKAAGGDSDSSSPTSSSPPPTGGPPPPSGPTRTIYSGPVSGQLAVTTSSTGASPSGGSVTGVCTSTRAIAGTLTISVDANADGSTSGSANTTGTVTEISLTVSPLCSPLPGTTPFARGGPLTGTAGNLGFRSETVATSPVSLSVTLLTTFSGALSGTVISGTLTHGEQISGVSSSGSTVNGSGSTTIPVTLTRQ